MAWINSSGGISRARSVGTAPKSTCARGPRELTPHSCQGHVLGPTASERGVDRRSWVGSFPQGDGPRSPIFFWVYLVDNNLAKLMFGLRRGLAVMCRHSSPTIGLCLPFSPCTVVPRPTQPMMGEALVSTPTPRLHALHEIPVSSLLPSLSTNTVRSRYVVLYRLAYYVGDP